MTGKVVAMGPDLFYTAQRENELTYLADFILEQPTDNLDRTIAGIIGQIGVDHAVVVGNCPADCGTEADLCAPWDRGLDLGIAWLKQRVADQAAELAGRGE